VAGVWKKLHDDLHNLHSLPSPFIKIRLIRMRWAGHVAQIGKGGMPIVYWRESQKDQDRRGLIIVR
jgi:hypothetical protein